MKHLYIKNCKILRKETEENTRNGKITYVHGRSLNIIKMALFFKLLYRFNTNTIPPDFFVETN